MIAINIVDSEKIKFDIRNFKYLECIFFKVCSLTFQLHYNKSTEVTIGFKINTKEGNYILYLLNSDIIIAKTTVENRQQHI